MKILATVMITAVTLWGCGEKTKTSSNGQNPNNGFTSGFNSNPNFNNGSNSTFNTNPGSTFTGNTVPGNTVTGNTTPGNAITTSGVLKYPLVLHHGFMDGTQFGSFGDMLKVFEGSGLRVFATEVSPANSIVVRAGQLAQQIQTILNQTGAAKVNIIAHSMGGLDARHLISRLGFGNRVASLTTLSTPHRGTPIADGANVIGTFYDANLLNLMGRLFGSFTNSSSKNLPVDVKAAINDLSEKYIQNTFNPSTPDSPNVYYQSYAGKTCLIKGLGCKDTINMMMQMSFGVLKLKSGDNDGMVSVESAKWGNFRGVLDADHIDLTGRTYLSFGPSGIDYKAFLQGVVNDLGQRGF